MITTTLNDERTGVPVTISQAQLVQTCHMCKEGLLGRLIASVPDGRGWTCMEHLEQRLLALPPARPITAELVSSEPRYLHAVLATARPGLGLREALGQACETAKKRGMQLDELRPYPDLALTVATFVGYGP